MCILSLNKYTADINNTLITKKKLKYIIFDIDLNQESNLVSDCKELLRADWTKLSIRVSIKVHPISYQCARLDGTGDLLKHTASKATSSRLTLIFYSREKQSREQNRRNKITCFCDRWLSCEVLNLVTDYRLCPDIHICICICKSDMQCTRLFYSKREYWEAYEN